MPGLLPIAATALVVAVVAWFTAWRYSRPAQRDPREDYRQLQRHTAWLEQRLDQARRERWDPQMVADLSHQLGIACRQLNRARGGIVDRRASRVP